MDRAPSQSFAERHRREMRMVVRVARAAAIALIAFFTASIAFGKSGWVFVDNVNLLFHEAGHFLFRPLGETMTVLGGTLHQLLWPLGFALYFWLKRRDRFAALVCAWWFGENLQNIAVYMRDAINMGLPLVGGEGHDWNNLFSRWGVLRQCLSIGNVTAVVGWCFMVAGLALGTWMAIFPSDRDAALPDPNKE